MPERNKITPANCLKKSAFKPVASDQFQIGPRIGFEDGSTLKLKVAGQATVSVGAKVKAVHEAGEGFQMDLEGGPPVLVRLANPGSSVALRDKSGTVEYLG